jgi:hypothetical protein
MNVRSLFAPLVAIAALAVTVPPAAANPHRVWSPRAPMTSTWHVAPPATKFKHVQLPAGPVFTPVYVPVYLPPWQAAGLGAFSAFGLNSRFGAFGLNGNGCQSNLPRTLGDLGFAGAGNSFAPVTLSSTPAFDILPSTQPLMTQQSYCQAPALDFSTLDLTD